MLNQAEIWLSDFSFAWGFGVLGLTSYGLDAVLEGCGLEPREADKPHEAETDADCAAKVYMHLKTLPDLKNTDLGFCK